MTEKIIGEIMDFFSQVSVIALKLSSGLKVGDLIKIKTGDDEVTHRIDSMQIDKKPVQQAKKGESVGIKINGKAHKGNKVYLVEE